MRDLDTQLRAWADQAVPVTADEAERRASGATPFDRLTPESGSRRRAWALLAAAVLVVVGIAALAFRGAGSDEPRPVTSGPGEPQPTAPLPTEPTVDTIETTVAVSADATRPAVLVAYAGDNRLVSLDPDTGDVVRVLAEGFDDPDLEIEGGPYVVADISVDQRRGRVVYGTCCEPAVGQMFAVDLADGDPVTFSFGDRPALSPDGSKLAYVQLQELRVLDLDTGEERTFPTSAFNGSTEPGGGRQVEYVIGQISWSPDGSQLLLATSEYGDGVSEIRLATFEESGSDLVFASSVLASGPIDGSESLSHPLFHTDGSVSWIRQGVLDTDGEAVVEERVIPYSDGDAHRTPLSQKVLSRFLDGRGIEWRLSADGTVTEDGQVVFTVPGLRALAG